MDKFAVENGGDPSSGLYRMDCTSLIIFTIQNIDLQKLYIYIYIYNLFNISTNAIMGLFEIKK